MVRGAAGTFTIYLPKVDHLRQDVVRERDAERGEAVKATGLDAIRRLCVFSSRRMERMGMEAAAWRACNIGRQEGCRTPGSSISYEAAGQ